MRLIESTNFTKSFSEKYKRMRLTTRLYGNYTEKANDIHR